MAVGRRVVNLAMFPVKLVGREYCYSVICSILFSILATALLMQNSCLKMFRVPLIL